MHLDTRPEYYLVFRFLWYFHFVRTVISVVSEKGSGRQSRGIAECSLFAAQTSCSTPQTTVRWAEPSWALTIYTPTRKLKQFSVVCLSFGIWILSDWPDWVVVVHPTLSYHGCWTASCVRPLFIVTGLHIVLMMTALPCISHKLLISECVCVCVFFVCVCVWERERERERESPLKFTANMKQTVVCYYC